jgi:hypothetical protein
MRIFYEKLAESVENYYDNKSTIENVLYLEDIIDNISRDIYVQYKNRREVVLSYQSSSIDIDGVIKCRNNLYFINYYRDKYSDFIVLENGAETKIKVKVINSNISGAGVYTIGIYVNDELLEQLQYTDKYKLNNNKIVQLYSTILGAYLNITWPLYLNANDYVEYTVYTIYVTEELALHKYLCVFDRVNNALIMNTKYSNNEISILLRSKGSLLRASTINDLYRLNTQSYFQYDVASSKIIITEPKLYKDGAKLKYIKTQYKIIEPSMLSIGYSLLGVYIDDDNNIQYDQILQDTSYSLLSERVNNYTLDNIRKERQYYGFILGVNNITEYKPLDMWLYDTASSSGTGGSSGVTKLTQDFTSEESLTIQFENGVPMIVVYDEDGNQIVPQETHYNMLDEITINFGESISGKVIVI